MNSINKQEQLIYDNISDISVSAIFHVVLSFKQKSLPHRLGESPRIMSLAQPMDLSGCVELIKILNINANESTLSPSQLITNSNMKKFILSDEDEEMLILIKFQQIVSLKSMTFHATCHDVNENVNGDLGDEHASQPRQVSLYKLPNLSTDFDNINSLTPDLVCICSENELSHGQTIQLQQESVSAIKFQNLHYLGIYIESNQNDTAKTIINSIILKGEVIRNKQSTFITEVPISSVSTKINNNHEKLPSVLNDDEKYNSDTSSIWYVLIFVQCRYLIFESVLYFQQ